MATNIIMPSREQEEEYWISISDLMAGLMMIFMFIAISYMVKVSLDAKQIQDIAKTYQLLQDDLYKDLLNEFRDDLPRWNAEIDRKTLSFRFIEPDVLFKRGKSEIRPRFKEILYDFFPRYVAILTQDKYRLDIEEVRIEGHTSSEWEGLTGLESYFENMDLSQNRTRSVLEYLMRLKVLSQSRNWLIKRVTANGLSYSRRKFINGTTTEDTENSRRVEFRVKTKAEDYILKILHMDTGKKSEAY